MIPFELFSNLIPIRGNLPPNLNKGFIEPPCIASNSDFWQKLDPSNGMGAIRYYTCTIIHKTYSHHHMRVKKEKVLETVGDYDSSRSDLIVEIPSSGKFKSGPSHVYKIEYIEQNFKPTDGLRLQMAQYMQR